MCTVSPRGRAPESHQAGRPGRFCLRADGVLTSPHPCQTRGQYSRQLRGQGPGNRRWSCHCRPDVASGHPGVGRAVSPHRADGRSRPTLSLRSVRPRPSLSPHQASVSLSAKGAHSLCAWLCGFDVVVGVTCLGGFAHRMVRRASESRGQGPDAGVSIRPRDGQMRSSRVRPQPPVLRPSRDTRKRGAAPAP